MPENKLSFIAYGSLLNRESATRTFKDMPPEGYPPVLALGARRVFNYNMPKELLEYCVQHYGGNFLQREWTALNVDYTRSPANALNGCLVTAAHVDIPKLGTREFGYDLRPAVCVYWGKRETAYLRTGRSERDVWRPAGDRQ
jgi:hypothetical protein